MKTKRIKSARISMAKPGKSHMVSLFRHPVTLFFFFGMPFTLLAQPDFRPGYILTNSGDTIQGEIDYRGDQRMSQVCRFRMHESERAKEYSPRHISGYRFHDSKFFVSRKLDGKDVFLEYLIRGKLDIYYLRDESGDHYYIDKGQLGITELPYEEGIRLVDGKEMSYRSSKHIGQLYYALQDTPELKSQISNLKKPGHENLIRLAKNYHNLVCEDEDCIVFEKNLPRLSVGLEPVFVLKKFRNSSNFISEFGSNVYLQLPRTHENLSLRTGARFQVFRTILTGSQYTLGMYSSRMNLVVPLQLSYLYAPHRIKPRVGAGYDIILMMEENFDFLHLLSAHLGVEYEFSDRLHLTAGMEAETFPMLFWIVGDDYADWFLSYSFYVGMVYKL